VLTQHTSIRENRLVELYESAPSTGVRLLIAHALTDAAVFAMVSPGLFRDKTLSVVLMGGAVKPQAINGRCDSEMLLPDMTSSKIMADPESGSFFIQRCQELGVPLTIITKKLAYQCRLPKAAFDAMSEHGGALGRQITHEAHTLVAWMHEQVKLPSESPKRELPAKCNERWFADNFCDGGMAPGADVWSMVENIRLCMPLLILASVPKVDAHFFETHLHQVRGIDHKLVGSENGSNGTSGISDQKLQKFRQYMFQFVLKGILMNLPDYDLHKLTEVPGLGFFNQGDSIPEWISVTHDMNLTMQECIANTFLNSVAGRIGTLSGMSTDPVSPLAARAVA